MTLDSSWSMQVAGRFWFHISSHLRGSPQRRQRYPPSSQTFNLEDPLSWRSHTYSKRRRSYGGWSSSHRVAHSELMKTIFPVCSPISRRRVDQFIFPSICLDLFHPQRRQDRQQPTFIPDIRTRSFTQTPVPNKVDALRNRPFKRLVVLLRP